MAIRIEHLNKHIGKQHVLKDVNLTIGDGEVIGLLGPNGAGKSTLMKIMVGVWDATSGEVQVPKSVGFLPEQNPLYEDMYVREYLRFFVELRTPKPLLLHSTPYTLHPTPYTLHPTPYTLHPTPYTRHPTPYTLHPTPYTLHQQVEDLINRVGLTAEANKKIGQLSKGYRQRVGLAQAMIGDPELLILDEPTTGLDPNQLEDIRTLIRNLGNSSVSTGVCADLQPEGRSTNYRDLARSATVILSTHILQEVKQMCTRVIIINHGEIKVDKPISEIEDLEETFKQATKNE